MTGELVEYTTPAQQSNRGYLAVPNAGTGPAVIVIQEWWGLVDHIKDVADRFAAAGFVALAPDLYHGETTTSPDEAGRLMMALNIEQTARDLKGAIEYLRSHPAVQGNRVGTVGFCLGGQLSLMAACENPEVGACVDFYGIHPQVHPDFSRLACPVLGFFGAKDEMVTPEAAKALEARIRAADRAVEFHVMPSAGHAFFNDSRPAAYHPEAARQAWEKTLGFFRQHL